MSCSINGYIDRYNKGVRSCCVYGPKYIGNIKDQSLVDIINSDEWKNIKQQMYANEWPSSCLSCKERERITGWSVRSLFTDEIFETTGWEEENITYLEFNGSNICNLACLHCTPGFSSRWVIDNKKARKVYDTYDADKQYRLRDLDAIRTHTNDLSDRSTKMHLPDPDLIIENLKQLDLSNLRTINFKGGEPLLNSEVPAILNYLEEQSILHQVTIIFSSNGTYINQTIIDLFKKCKSIRFNISIDGIGSLFNYIRYGDAKFEDIEPTIAELNKLPNIKIDICTAVMNYNIYHLDDIRSWTTGMREKYSVVAYPVFANCVQEPAYLSVRTLSDQTRKELANYYSGLPMSHQFEQVIMALNSEYIGDEIHNYWVDFTHLMEVVRENSILNIVSQLTEELQYV